MRWCANVHNMLTCVCLCVEERVQTSDVCEWRQRVASSAGGEGAWPASLPYKALCCPGIGVPLVVVRSDLGCNTVRARPHHPPTVTMATPPPLFPARPSLPSNSTPGTSCVPPSFLRPFVAFSAHALLPPLSSPLSSHLECCGPALNTS